MTQADIEARARETLAAEHRATTQAEYNSSGTVTFAAARRAMLAFREEARREAFAEAAEVARGVKRRVPYDQNKHPCTTTMEQIATAIAALGEQGRLG